MKAAPKHPTEETPQPAPPAEAPAGEEEKGAKKEKPGRVKEGKEPKPKAGKASASAPPGAPKKTAKPVPDNPNFRYIVRVAESDLDGQRATALALSEIRGIGLRTAEVVCQLAQVNPDEMIGNLPEPTVDGIEALLGELPKRVPPWLLNHPRDYAGGETQHFIAGDLDTSRRDDINLMKMIRAYKGVRHDRGQKVRGQRTRSKGRTGMAAGVLKKAAKEAAQAKEAEAPAAAPAAPASPAAKPS